MDFVGFYALNKKRKRSSESIKDESSQIETPIESDENYDNDFSKVPSGDPDLIKHPIEIPVDAALKSYDVLENNTKEVENPIKQRP